MFVCRSFVLIHFQRHHLSATQIEVIRTVFLLPCCPFNCDSINCLQCGHGVIGWMRFIIDFDDVQMELIYWYMSVFLRRPMFTL